VPRFYNADVGDMKGQTASYYSIKKLHQPSNLTCKTHEAVASGTAAGDCVGAVIADEALKCSV